MTLLNKRITKHLASAWIRQNFATILFAFLMITPIIIFLTNADLSSTVETAIVKSAVNTPDKYSSTDYYVVALLADGKTIYVYLPQTWVPPSPGKTIRVKRITRLFFGERFVLLR
jgi:hypothetical protein